MRRRTFVIATVVIALLLLSIPKIRAVTVDANVHIVDATGNIINGVASAVTALVDENVHVVDSTGHIVNSFGGGGSITTDSTLTGNGTGGSPLSVAVIKRASISLTANQLNHLHSSPVTLVAAGGSGTIIAPVAFTYAMHAGSVANFGPNGADMYVGYLGNVSAVGVPGSMSWDAGTFTTIGQSNFITLPGILDPSVGGATSGNYDPLTLASTRGNYALGNNQPLVLWTVSDFINAGAVATSSITAGNAGTLYAAGDTGFLSSTGDGTAAYVVDTVSAGAVATYHLTANGTGYVVGTGEATATGGSQPGIGTGFQIDIGTITPGNGSGSVTVLSYNVTLP